jgi:hypothetical protein
MKKQHMPHFIVLLLITASWLAACGGASAEATATAPSVESVFTAAAQTMQAQLTAAALAQPSATPTPNPTETPPASATLPTTSTTAPAYIPPVSGGGNTGAVGCNNSAYVSDVTVPDGQQFAPGAAFTKTWRIQNTGTCPWNTNYKVVFVSGDQMGGAATAISQSVAAGATIDVSVALTAPSAPKTAYVGYWQIANESEQNFGARFYVQIAVGGTPVTGTQGTTTPTITPTAGAVGCFNSALAGESDTSKVTAGQTFKKSWTLKNTGTCDWNENFKFKFTGGELMGSDTTKLRKGTVKPGASVAFEMNFTAPSAPGTYIGYWRLETDTGQLFGSVFTVKVILTGATYTPSRTPTPVTPTNTPITPTNTPVTPTETPVTPSATPETPGP